MYMWLMMLRVTFIETSNLKLHSIFIGNILVEDLMNRTYYKLVETFGFMWMVDCLQTTQPPCPHLLIHIAI